MTNEQKRLELLLNQLFALRPTKLDELKASIPLDSVQGQILLQSFAEYPELPPTVSEMSLWNFINTVVDILCGMRLSAVTDPDTRIVHRVRWKEGRRPPPPPLPTFAMDNEDEDDEDNEDPHHDFPHSGGGYGEETGDY